MTREEQIKYEAALNYPFTAISVQEKCESEAFIKGAKWADKTMKEKVLNFIHTYFYEHPHVNCHICADSFESLEEMESELMKTMEK